MSRAVLPVTIGPLERGDGYQPDTKLLVGAIKVYDTIAPQHRAPEGKSLTRLQKIQHEVEQSARLHRLMEELRLRGDARAAERQAKLIADRCLLEEERKAKSAAEWKKIKWTWEAASQRREASLTPEQREREQARLAAKQIEDARRALVLDSAPTDFGVNGLQVLPSVVRYPGKARSGDRLSLPSVRDWTSMSTQEKFDFLDELIRSMGYKVDPQYLECVKQNTDPKRLEYRRRNKDPEWLEYLKRSGTGTLDEALRMLSGYAARIGDVRSYTWTIKIGGLGESTCGNRYALHIWTDPKIEVAWSNCKRRACSFCGPLRSTTDRDNVMNGFMAMGKDVYRYVTTREKADSVVSYATRFKQAAVAIPMMDPSFEEDPLLAGQAVVAVYTTMQRVFKGGELVHAIDANSTREAKIVQFRFSDDDESYFATILRKDIVRIPAYRVGDGKPHFRMRPNKYLKLAQAEAQAAQTEVEAATKAEKSAEGVLEPQFDREALRRLPKAVIELAVEHHLVTAVYPNGEVRTIDTSKAGVHVKARIVALLFGEFRPQSKPRHIGRSLGKPHSELPLAA